jgi:exosortase/archaeosortase family protein
MLTLPLKQTLKEIPESVKSFSKRAVLLYIGWLAVYQLILVPTGEPDKWLTRLTADATVLSLNSFYASDFTVDQPEKTLGDGKRHVVSAIMYNKVELMFIADGCNAFSLWALYTGFLFCIPASIKRIFIFTIGGTVSIFILNIGRCYALAWLCIKRPAWVNFTHHYIFTLIVYSCIFTLWVWYSKKYNAKDEKA